MTNFECPNCFSKLVTTLDKVFVTKKKIETNLCHCKTCDYLFLSNPNWLDIAYELEFFGDSGYVLRNLNIFKKSITLFRCWKIISNNQVLPDGCDMGAGLGIYARLMRDNGYNFFGSDEFCSMPLIRPFVETNSGTLIKTAFEVVEHLPSLTKFLKEQVKEVDLFLFSTELRDEGVIPKSDWWYYVFPTGQHIGFHSKKSLSFAFEIAGYDSKLLISYGSSFHALTNTKKWNIAFRIAKVIWMLNSLIEIISKKIVSKIFKERSLTKEDYIYSMKKLN